MTPVIPDPYAVVDFHGKPLDNATVSALKTAESRLGYELTIYQGIGGAAASGGTHIDGRAVDLAPYDWKRKVKVLRDLGFAAWHRPAVAGLWVEHIHAILIFPDRGNRRGISDSGYAQIGKYDRREDGLAGSTPDPDQYRPKPVAQWSEKDYERSFTVPAQRPVVTHVSKARNSVTEAIHDVSLAIVELQKANRPSVKAQIVGLRAARASLRAVRKALPKK